MKCSLSHPGQVATRIRTLCLLLLLAWPGLGRLAADSDVYLLNVPDYDWQFGCFGTATGNLFGYWDRNGLPDYYTGPTAGGVAPLYNSGNHSTDAGIRSMWASQKGFDGRPSDRRGHIDDYWDAYESTSTDRYVRSNWVEHASDCIGDFIGLNQKKWTNMNGECSGNIDGYVFNYWDARGARRINYTPPPDAGMPPRDLQSGLRAWSHYCGYEADSFSQLVEFNPQKPAGQGFTFADLKREINAGYPVLVFLQSYSAPPYRAMGGMAKANPDIHGMLIFGYREDAYGGIARCRTSWAYGDAFYTWDTTPWVPWVSLSVRGVIGFHPKPRITRITRGSTKISIAWDGPSAQLYDAINGTTNDVHYYVVEKSSGLNPADFQPVTAPSTQRSAVLVDTSSQTSFYRVRMVDTP